MKEVYTIQDLRNWSEESIRLGVIGAPVAHSLSPQIQNAALQASGIAMQYARFEIAPDELASALELMHEREFLGANLTAPHKIAALSLMEDLDSNAKRIGAINTIKFCHRAPVTGSTARNATATGFNTDGAGFARAIREAFAVDLRDLRVLVLGAGGAARAISFECARAHCERLVIANRTFAKARALANALREFFIGPKVLGPVPRLHAIPLEENALRFQIGHTDLVVNATSLGLRVGDATPVPARLIEPHLFIYDIVYAKDRETRLLRAAREVGARAADGLLMLLRQSALSFEIWFEREAPLPEMRAALGVN